jgi:hypothetical protein
MWLWEHLTEAQATVISGLLTLLSGLIVAVVTPLVIGKEFRSVKDAAKDAKDVAQSITDDLKNLQAQLSAVRNEVADLPEAEPQQGDAPGAERRSALKDLWSEIRARVEEKAADPKLKGQTRAKYARIDRRTFKKLIDALDADSNLGNNGALFREANTIWNTYRPNRVQVSDADLARMTQLRDSLLGNDV